MLRMVPLPRLAWEDSPAATVGGCYPPLPRSGGGGGEAVRRYADVAVDHRSNEVWRRPSLRKARLNANRHFNVLVEPVQHRHEAINGEAGKLRLSNARKIRRRKACEFMSATNGQLLIVENAYDLRGEVRLE